MTMTRSRIPKWPIAGVLAALACPLTVVVVLIVSSLR